MMTATIRRTALAATTLLALAACSGSDSATTDSMLSTSESTPAVDAPTTLPAPETTAPPAPTTLPERSEPCAAYADDTVLPVELCSSGTLVVEMQNALANFDPAITVDGLFGPATELVVFRAQGEAGLPIDGRADQALLDFANGLAASDDTTEADDTDTDGGDGVEGDADGAGDGAADALGLTEEQCSDVFADPNGVDDEVVAACADQFGQG